MPYAEGRTYYDADSHLMELTDWLIQYADPGLRERIRPLYLGGAGALAEQAVRDAEARRGDPAAAPRVADNVMAAKGWPVLGGFDPAALSPALGLPGVRIALVVSTLPPTQSAGYDVELLSGGTRAHNRAIADSCSGDQRMIAVGLVPWGDPARALAEAKEAIRLGCGAILVPSAPPRDRSPTHPDYHP